MHIHTKPPPKFFYTLSAFRGKKNGKLHYNNVNIVLSKKKSMVRIMQCSQRRFYEMQILIQWIWGRSESP